MVWENGFLAGLNKVLRTFQWDEIMLHLSTWIFLAKVIHEQNVAALLRTFSLSISPDVDILSKYLQ